jgi:hypothetical protein
MQIAPCMSFGRHTEYVPRTYIDYGSILPISVLLTYTAKYNYLLHTSLVDSVRTM